MKEKRCGIFMVLTAAVLLMGALLLKNDMMHVLKWWAVMLAGTLCFYPACSSLLAAYDDSCWIFSKVLGFMIPGYVVWLLCSLKLAAFSSALCIVVFFVCTAVQLVIIKLTKKKEEALFSCFKEMDVEGAVRSELIFTLAFVSFLYIRSFSPNAFGTERMMDYSFMKSISLSSYFPPEDVWFSGKTLNYYYFGQYILTYISKLSFVPVEMAYNVSQGSCFALCLTLAASLGLAIYGKRDKFRKLTGLFSVLAVSFASNMHFIVFYKVVPMMREILGIEGQYNEYWYPDSTRYIGYHPEVPDKTAHEFPAYSFILGDMHAHVINIFVVLTITAAAFSYMKMRKMNEGKESSIAKTATDKRIWLIGFLTGISLMENAWDFPIYFVVAGAVILFANLMAEESLFRIVIETGLQGGIVLITAFLISLPFSMGFDAMVNGLALCETHSRFYQLFILWGMPVIMLAAFTAGCIKRYRAGKNVDENDVFVILIGLCALGLVMIPEIVYVKDIYEGSYKRFNTMFKLTYQAFILFALMQAQVIGRAVSDDKDAGRRKAGIAALVLLILCSMYFPVAVNMGIGKVGPGGEMKGLAADAYVYEQCPMDAQAIDWIKKNIERGSVVLEANGDSYTIYNRVSTLSGMPTILGWHTHEWLWQNDADVVDERSDDVEAIYLGRSADEIRKLTEKYGVDYIFIGSCEYEKYLYGGMNVELLKSLGEVVYDGGGPEPVYIIKL